MSSLTVLAFNLVLVAVCGFAYLKGGAPERIVSLMLPMAALATYLAHQFHTTHYQHLEWETLAVDLLLVVGLALVAVRANRFWPMWMVAIHATAVAVHLSRAIDPKLLPPIYLVAAAFSAIPGLALLVIGTIRHRQRLKRFGNDPPWNDSSVR